MSKKAEEYLLPESLIPVSYNITLSPDFETKQFTGEISINIKALVATKKITLHSLDLDVSKEDILVSGKKEYKVDGLEVDKKHQFVIISVDKEMEKDEMIRMDVKYKGMINDKMMGFYYSKYGDKNEYIGVTQFEATDARRCLICFDQPNKKAVFKLTLIIDKQYDAISNTDEESNTLVDDGKKKKIVFKETPKMSTYLVAFVIGKFISIEGKANDNTKVRVFATKTEENKNEYLETALKYSIRVVDYYNKLFGIDYSDCISKLDLVAVPSFAAGAMENWGCVTYRQERLMIKKETPKPQIQATLKTISHEISHSWFGNMVTMYWWDALWLNEGFARFLENFALDKFYPHFNIFEAFQANCVNRAFELDSLKTTHPLNVKDICTPEEINEIFDGISYSKGGSVIRHLVSWVGSDTFFMGIRSYLKRFLYKNAKQNDLWDELSKASKKDVKEVMSTFTDQEGYPIISVSLLKEKNKFKLKLVQQRYMKSGETDDKLWFIPIVIKCKSTPEFSILMKKKELILDLDNYKEEDWIKVNYGQKGFYRCNYSKELIKKLSSAIVNKEIDVASRLQLLSDQFAVGFSGGYENGLAEALELAKSYESNDNYYVYSELNAQLFRLYSLFPSEKFKAINDKLKEMLIKVNLPIFKKYGFESSDKSHFAGLYRSRCISSLLECECEDVITKTKEIYRKFIDEKKEIDPSIKGLCLRNAVKFGGKKEYEEMKKLYLSTKSDEEKNMTLSAVCYCKDEPTIKSTIKFFFEEDNVKMQDIFYPIHFLSGNKYSNAIMWKYFTKNWETIFLKKLGDANFVLAYCVKCSSGRKLTHKDADEFESFFKAHPCAAVERTVQQVVERIRINATFIDKEKDKLATFLGIK